MFMPRTRWASMNALSFSAAATLSFTLAPALGTKSAMPSPRLVIVKLLPALTCRSNSGSFSFRLVRTDFNLHTLPLQCNPNAD